MTSESIFRLRVMPALAQAGFHVIAPDQRGYGRTTGWDPDYDGDLASYRLFNLVRDVMGLLDALGRTEVALLAGHDFGASVAAWAALIRPDIFHKLALMSAPFPGPPDISPQPPPARSIHAELAALDRPRKHYQWYYSTRRANAEMQDCPQGVHAFLRAYFHHKSADWSGNRPFRLATWSAEELARMPTYYIMDRDRTMAETVAAEMPGEEETAACRWLPDAELAVYAREYERKGFQGGLQWYRCRTSGRFDREHELFSGRRIEVPACFISGSADWGIYQAPGALEAMEERAADWDLAGRRCRALGPAGAAGRCVGPADGLCVGACRFAPGRPPAASRASTIATRRFSVRSCGENPPMTRNGTVVRSITEAGRNPSGR